MLKTFLFLIPAYKLIGVCVRLQNDYIKLYNLNKKKTLKGINLFSLPLAQAKISIRFSIATISINTL